MERRYFGLGLIMPEFHLSHMERDFVVEALSGLDMLDGSNNENKNNKRSKDIFMHVYIIHLIL